MFDLFHQGENVLLDSDGYTVIIDLGFAKVIKDKTYTFCGTPLYLAPEIIMQKGHDKGADHWSWGVLVYESIIGSTPFYEKNMDQMTLFKTIIKGKVAFPEKGMSTFSKDLIRRMLVVRPRERLGSFSARQMTLSAIPGSRKLIGNSLPIRTLKHRGSPILRMPLTSPTLTIGIISTRSQRSKRR